MNDHSAPLTHRRGKVAILLQFLGSMNLAITLLIAVAIASVIGTVLQQNQPYPEYLIKFGPFWFEIYRSLGLYDIYGSAWFLVLLGFLLLSTSVCVVRYTPRIWREMRHLRLDVQEKSLRAFHHRSEWASGEDRQLVLARVETYLRNRGYRVASKEAGGRLVVAASKGATNRLGYLLTHVAIVVICVGGLIDGNLPLKFRELTGAVRIETRDVPVSEMRPESILAPGTAAFRGSVSISEGDGVDFTFLAVRDGYLVQRLPFRVALEEFRVEYHPTGQAKSFESDLVIHDEALEESLRATIAVNHPLRYRGYAIYQSSFSDGGSRLSFLSWPLQGQGAAPEVLEGHVNRGYRLETPTGRMQLELMDFKLFNIFPVEPGEGDTESFRNFGPSVVFRLRDAQGVAREYVNYLSPITFDGRSFLLSGVRASQAEPYRYLHIPADRTGGAERFMRLRALAADPASAREAAMRHLEHSSASAEQRDRVADSLVELVAVFIGGGVDAVVERIGAMAEPGEREALLQAYMNALQSLMASLYLETLKAEEIDPAEGVSEADAQFFDDAMNAFSLVGPYGSPLYLQPTGFEHREASGLQITRSPGKVVVYLGCIMLMLGVFFMFYVHQRRLWLVSEIPAGGGRLLFAGAAMRERLDFGAEFERLSGDLQALTAGRTEKTSEGE